MSWYQYFNAFTLLKLLALLIGGTLICGFFFLSREISAASQLTDFFSQNKQVVFFGLRQNMLPLDKWPHIQKITIPEHNLLILNLGEVSSFTCRKLLQSKLAFPHQFWIETNQVDADSSELCGFFTTKLMAMQLSANFEPFAHLSTQNTACTCDKAYISFGICTNKCFARRFCKINEKCNHDKLPR